MLETAEIETNKINPFPSPEPDDILKIITKSSAKASAIAALPIPVLDIAGVSFIQLQMVKKIGEKYGISSTDNSSVLISSVITSLLGKLISVGISQAANATNLDKMLGESLVKASIAGFVTTITGEVYDNHFKNKGSFEDISVDGYLDYLKEQINSDRLSLDKLGAKAVAAITGN